MKKVLAVALVLSLGAFLASVMLAGAESPKCKPQANCYCSGKIDKQVFADYKGKRVYFCCEGCKGKFNKDPEKYLKEIENQGVTLEATPIVKPDKTIIQPSEKKKADASCSTPCGGCPNKSKCSGGTAK